MLCKAKRNEWPFAGLLSRRWAVPSRIQRREQQPEKRAKHCADDGQRSRQLLFRRIDKASTAA
jgi:hypothetical protein